MQERRNSVHGPLVHISKTDFIMTRFKLFHNKNTAKSLKDSPIVIALTCMKFYLYNKNGNFVKEADTSAHILNE